MDKKNIVKFVLAGLIVLIIVRMITCRKSPRKEKYGDGWGEEAYTDFDPAAMTASELPQTSLAPGVTAPAVSAPPSATLIPAGSMGPMSKSVDLLPKPPTSSSEFGEFAPKSLQGQQSFLDPTRYIGVDSVGSSLRNANYQLRRDPPVTKTNVGPWSQSSIDADLMRRPLDC
jgi:hypothetical protein